MMAEFRSIGGFGRKEALVGILAFAVLAAALVFAVRRNPEQKNIDRARLELAVLASALEAFKKNNGDYPNIPPDGGQPGLEGLSSERLFLALTGWRDARVVDAMLPAQGMVFIDPTQFRLKTPWRSNGPKENQFIDPWGNPYRYVYFKDGSLKSFVLYSCGPDGETTTAAYSGSPFHLKDGRDIDADNIYAVSK